MRVFAPQIKRPAPGRARRLFHCNHKRAFQPFLDTKAFLGLSAASSARPAASSLKAAGHRADFPDPARALTASPRSLHLPPSSASLRPAVSRRGPSRP